MPDRCDPDGGGVGGPGPKDLNLRRPPGEVVRKFQTKASPAEYRLFRDSHDAGVIEDLMMLDG